MDYKKIATYIFTEALQETHYWVGTVDIEQVEDFFDVKLTFDDYSEITNELEQLFGDFLLDINNYEDDYYWEERQFSLNFYGDFCFNDFE